MNEEILKCRGLPSHNSKKLLKAIASLKNQCRTNGVVSGHHVGSAAAFSHASGESSTTSCSSECSSPSPPPELKGVRTQSPTSSGSDGDAQNTNGPKKWPRSCEASEASPMGSDAPEMGRVGTQPPTVVPMRYGPPGSQTVILDPQQRFYLLTDRHHHYSLPRAAPLRNVAPPGSKGSDLTTVTTTATFAAPAMYGFVPGGVFPQHSFPPFLHTGAGVSHTSNGYLSGFPFLPGGGFAPTTVTAAYVPMPPNYGAAPSATLVVPPAGPKVATCYNCGLAGHRGHECKEASVEEVTKSAQYRLNFSSSSSTPSEPQP